MYMYICNCIVKWGIKKFMKFLKMVDISLVIVYYEDI